MLLLDAEEMAAALVKKAGTGSEMAEGDEEAKQV